MTTRQEDELDLIAMGIAEAVKRSDNLRVPRDPETAVSYMKRVKETDSDVADWGWRSSWKGGAV